MARRRRTARKTTASRGRRFGGRMGRGIDKNALLAGAIAGFAAPMASKFSPKWGPTVALGATGAFMGNATLQTLAGLAAGSAIGGGMSGAAPTGAGGWL